MTTIENDTPQAQTSVGFLEGLAMAVKRARQAFARWHREEAAIQHLQAMSDRELRDIGVSRSEIDFAVRGKQAKERHFVRYY